MADNNTFVLFEEIKNKLETIYRELKELREKGIGTISGKGIRERIEGK